MAGQSTSESRGLEKFSNFILEPHGILPPIHGFENKPLVSLEEAVKPLETLVPSIRHMVWTVTEDISEVHNGLSKDESASIRLYTLEWSGAEISFYKILNEELRERNREKLKPWFLYLRLFVHALSKLPSNLYKVIYRGIKMHFDTEFLPDKKFFWWAFSSCTSSLKVLETFIGNTGPRTIFNIISHSAIDIVRHSYHPDEKEVLFYPARRFKVNSKFGEGTDLHIIEIEEIEPPFTQFQIPAPIPSPRVDQFIKILLIGDKSVGKATFINAFVNYLSFKTVKQARTGRPTVLKPLSFRAILNDTFEERTFTFGDFHPPGPVNTSRCQTYTFDPHLNDRKTLQIIDTPSLEDTPQQNQTNNATIQHILDYVSQLSHINAVCFLLQPDASRLSTTFQTCFVQLINRLGRNARNNVVFCFTNALLTFSTPGSTASLVRKMFASHSLNDIPFSRNNSFFFENESFRYLVAAQNGAVFSSDDQAEYSGSWSIAVTESSRFLDYIRKLPSITLK